MSQCELSGELSLVDSDLCKYVKRSGEVRGSSGNAGEYLYGDL